MSIRLPITAVPLSKANAGITFGSTAQAAGALYHLKLDLRWVYRR